MTFEIGTAKDSITGHDMRDRRARCIDEAGEVGAGDPRVTDEVREDTHKGSEALKDADMDDSHQDLIWLETLLVRPWKVGV